MLKWYDLKDVFDHKVKNKGLKDAYSSYRGRISRTHAKFVRHVALRKKSCGRPEMLTVITWAGIEALYEDEPLPRLKSCRLPMRLTDSARIHLAKPGVFSTALLEPKERLMTASEFIQFLTDIDAHEGLIEPDFIPL